jgi:hypothetical protein
VFPWNQPYPGREPPPCAEGCSVTDSRDERGRGDRPDSWYGHKTLTGFVLIRRLVEQRICLVNPHRHLIEFQLQLREQHTQCAG